MYHTVLLSAESGHSNVTSYQISSSGTSISKVRMILSSARSLAGSCHLPSMLIKPESAEAKTSAAHSTVTANSVHTIFLIA